MWSRTAAQSVCRPQTNLLSSSWVAGGGGVKRANLCYSGQNDGDSGGQHLGVRAPFANPSCLTLLPNAIWLPTSLGKTPFCWHRFDVTRQPSQTFCVVNVLAIQKTARLFLP